MFKRLKRLFEGDAQGCRTGKPDCDCSWCNDHPPKTVHQFQEIVHEHWDKVDRLAYTETPSTAASGHVMVCPVKSEDCPFCDGQAYWSPQDDTYRCNWCGYRVDYKLWEVHHERRALWLQSQIARPKMASIYCEVCGQQAKFRPADREWVCLECYKWSKSDAKLAEECKATRRFVLDPDGPICIYPLSFSCSAATDFW